MESVERTKIIYHMQIIKKSVPRTNQVDKINKKGCVIYLHFLCLSDFLHDVMEEGR
jgi:hypothetical protein